MKTLLPVLATALFSAAASAAPTLVATLTAPSELENGQSEIYTLTVRNTGNVMAQNVTSSMLLAPGMQVLAMPSLCSVDAQMSRLQCGLDVVPAGKSRSYEVRIQAPAAPTLAMHQMVVTASNAATSQSTTLTANYRHYDVAVAPGSLWQMRSCGSTSGPVPYNYCPVGSERVTNITFAAGGAVVIGQSTSPNYRWEQVSPSVVLFTQFDSSGAPYFVVTYSAINARCLRGPGARVQPGSTAASASTICRL